MAAINLQSGGEAAGSAHKIEQASSFSMALHMFNAFERFQGANEDGRGGSRRFTDHVEHKVRAVIEKDVHMAGGEIHGTNARCGPAEVMTGGIAGRIRFRLHDASAEAAGRKLMNDDFADQKARQRDCARWEFGAAQAANGNFLIGALHGCWHLGPGSVSG